jgi:hypothetical protein
MNRCDEVWKLLEWNLGHIRNFINITDHDDRLVGYESMNGAVGVSAIHESQENALALIFLTRPRAFILWSLFSLDDNVRNLVKPLGITLFIVLKIQLLGAAHVVHLSLDKYETVYVSVETLETKLQDVKFIVEHEGVYEHLNL